MNDDDDRVGYKRPPKQHQFRKGRSGNPKGRPKKQKALSSAVAGSLDDFIVDELRQNVTVTMNGESTQLALVEAIIARSVRKPDMGRLEIRYWLEELRRIEQAEEKERSKTFAAWRKIKAEGQRAIASAKANGLPVPRLVPHPDDIFFDWAAGKVRVEGPIDDDDLPRYEFMALSREYCYAQWVMFERDRRTVSISYKGQEVCLWALMAATIDLHMPPSMKFVMEVDGLRVMKFQSMRKRELRQWLRHRIGDLLARIRELERLGMIEESTAGPRTIFDFIIEAAEKLEREAALAKS